MFESDSIGHKNHSVFNATRVIGYYVVKNPSQHELNQNITRAQAKQSERDFFGRTAPWNQVDPGMRNFGADILTQRLGELLRKKIEEEMPKMWCVRDMP